MKIFTVEYLIDQLRTAVGGSGSAEARILERVAAVACEAAARKAEWLRPEMRVVDPQQGFGVHELHVEPGFGLTVLVVNWLPGRGTPPHDHGTWAVVAGLDGTECNRFWQRLDDRSVPGHARIVPMGERDFGDGDVLRLPAGAIHSVRNTTDRTATSLHIYGRHVNHAQRSQFDPEHDVEKPFLLATRAPAELRMSA
jgi:predicted metal-dependent enzyme (double-stranded beta helix superfamily)